MSDEIEGPKIIGVLYMLSSLPFLISYAMGLGWSIVYHPSSFSLVSLVYLLVVVVIPLSFGWGLASMHPWGWGAALVYNVVAIVALVFGLFSIGSIFWMTVFSIYLLTPRVRDAFHIGTAKAVALSE
ncbi:hypothetical protein EU546_03850 [Candidatus Thorarchaeota archaeon]|nr:MAG: hypothetical protein EU546_03850 [Candidatus Thorarchaeota archaeon]